MQGASLFFAVFADLFCTVFAICAPELACSVGTRERDRDPPAPAADTHHATDTSPFTSSRLVGEAPPVHLGGQGDPGAKAPALSARSESPRVQPQDGAAVALRVGAAHVDLSPAASGGQAAHCGGTRSAEREIGQRKPTLTAPAQSKEICSSSALVLGAQPFETYSNASLSLHHPRVFGRAAQPRAASRASTSSNY